MVRSGSGQATARYGQTFSESSQLLRCGGSEINGARGIHRRIGPADGSARVVRAEVEPIVEVCLIDTAPSVLNQTVKAERHYQHPKNQESSKSSRAHCDRE
jgi:hypothetical protein